MPANECSEVTYGTLLASQQEQIEKFRDEWEKSIKSIAPELGLWTDLLNKMSIKEDVDTEATLLQSLSITRTMTDVLKSTEATADMIEKGNSTAFTPSLNNANDLKTIVKVLEPRQRALATVSNRGVMLIELQHHVTRYYRVVTEVSNRLHSMLPPGSQALTSAAH